jgi:hypothetical protein
VLAALAFPEVAQGAGTSQLSLSPNTGSIKKGDTIVITIKESSTVPVNLIEADLNYNPAFLEYVSFDKSGGAFADSNNTFFISTISTGKVSLTGAILTGSLLTGEQTLATVTFKAVAGTGTSSITFDNVLGDDGTQSDVQNGGVSSWDGNTAGATFSFTGNSPTATTTASTSPPPVTPKATSKTTSKPTAATNTTPTPSQEVTTTSTSATGNPPSYFVAIKVTDGKNPIAGASVTIDGQTRTTDPSGIAAFNHITAGPHVADVTYKGKHASQPITVEDKGDGLEVQQFSVVLGASRFSQGLIIAVAILLLILIIGGGLSLGRKLLVHQPNLGGQPPVAQMAAGSGNSQVNKVPVNVTPPPPPPATTSGDINPVGQIYYPDADAQQLKPPPDGNKDT